MFSHFLFFAYLSPILVSPRSISIELDPNGPLGPRFDGVGGVSGGGGGSRLLVDYPDKQRNEIYDLLFKPEFGASLHALKVEIGCDADTTQGSEQTHMRDANDDSETAFFRGYENELMVQARQRNPDIHLSGMQWGAPAWVGDKSIFTEQNKDYLIAWINGLKKYRNLTIDSIGVSFNEEYYNKTWIIEMKARLVNNGYANIKTIAADMCCGRQYQIANDMLKDENLRKSVDVIGTHCPGPVNGQKSPTDEMMSLGVPFWDTEQHFGVPDPRPWGLYDFRGFIGVAQVINRNYIDAKHVATWMWTPIYSWYDWVSFRGKGLLAANQPWSGYYNASGNTPIWALAHTSQFTKPGWHFLGNSFNCSYEGSPCGSIGENSTSGSYVAYISQDKKEVTLVIETFGADDDTIFTISLRIGKVMFLWTSKRDETFVRSKQTFRDSFQITVPKDQLWTLTTIDGGLKGTNGLIVPDQAPFPLPFRSSFENLSEDSLAPYFSDMNGAFSIGSINGRKCLVQHTREVPLATHSGHHLRYFATAIGDSFMTNYNVSVNMMAEESPNAVLFLGTHGGTHNIGPDKIFDTLSAGLVFILNMTRESAYSYSLWENGQALINGTEEIFVPNRWYKVEIGVGNGAAFVNVDGKIVMSSQVSVQSGPVYLGSGHHKAYFDDVKIFPN